MVERFLNMSEVLGLMPMILQKCVTGPRRAAFMGKGPW
jgi:hypothetical protein